MSADIEVYGYAPEGDRAAALQAALRHLTREPLFGLSVSYVVSDRARREQSLRQRQAAEFVGARIRDGRINLEDAVECVGRLYDATVMVDTGLVVPCFPEDIFVDLVCCGDSFPRPPGGRFRLHIDRGYKRLGAAVLSDVEVPMPISRQEALAIRGYRWAKNIEAILPVANAASSKGFRCLWIGFEDGSEWPFDSYAVTHADEESLSLDFARNWLTVHGRVSRERTVGASREELRALVESTSEVPVDKGRFLDRRDLWGKPISAYDGSLSRADVQALFRFSPHEVAQAVEAVAVPAGEMERLFETAESACQLLADGNPSAPVAASHRSIPYASRFRRWPNGALLLHSYLFRPVWPVYRDAAALLLGGRPWLATPRAAP